jgi:hypothetical protein
MHGFNEYVDLDLLRKSTEATALFIVARRRWDHRDEEALLRRLEP